MLWFAPNTLASLFLAINLIWLLRVPSRLWQYPNKYSSNTKNTPPEGTLSYHSSIDFSRPFEFHVWHL